MPFSAYFFDMRCLYSTILYVFLFVSCQNMGSGPKQQAIVAVADSIMEDFDQAEKPADSAVILPVPELRTRDYVEGKTLLLGAYRIWEEDDDLAVKMKGDWFELHQKGDGIEVSAIPLTFEDGFDDCAGVKTKSLKTENKSLMLLQLPKLKIGNYKTTTLLNDHPWPKEKVDFTFHGAAYQLQGFGDITGTEMFLADENKDKIFHNVSNYELRLADAKGNLITLVSEESFNDTFIQIKFVGDLDGDNQPDFIISAPRNYEEERVLLILSTDIQQDSITIYECSRQFDC